jgi:2',3'-cyclic-nucleotide 2'-phosphodiesterase (5'-nucleotidase family)
MHATFVAAGPGIRKQAPVAGIRAIDLAPTLSFLLGIDGPQNARGKILVSLTTKPSLKVYSILDISDYHGQLVPLTEAADNLAAPGANPAFTIGGSAFLKPWFDVYRAESQNGSITVAAGDSIGATPPISSFFGDKPTIEMMNAMGFNADGLGNHNFDKGQTYLRTEIIPLANYPFLSSNVLDANNTTPAEWKPSEVFSLDGGKFGLVGFTNEDAPTLVFPNAFDPFHVANRVSTVQAEVNRLRAQGLKTIVVMGHDGATAGTLTNPTGPIVDLADQLTGVDVVIGDHTDFQVISRRGNKTLVTENRSKGIRFTRIRIVVDPTTKTAVYTTADFHKPWDIGVTADPAIQARITDLNEQLKPIFAVLTGNAKKAIPRADQCGNGNGRTCESLVGDVITDAIRATYHTPAFPTDFAITNSGGIRADLTCPTTDNPSDFCPAFTPPPYPITRGQVNTVLPFGNIAVTLTVNGAELKSMLERGVSAMPAVDGRFPQVSGLCFTYNIEAAVGSRVTGAVRADAAGNCLATPVDLTAAASYNIVSNDFTISGGDGYPNFASRMHTQSILDQVVADYIAAQTAANLLLNPVVKAFPDGRINCSDPTPGVGNNCPNLVASPPAP